MGFWVFWGSGFRVLGLFRVTPDRLGIGRGRLRPISTSANFFFRVRPVRLRPISTSANFDFGQFRLRPISTSASLTIYEEKKKQKRAGQSI